jgi:hypothetical protein
MTQLASEKNMAETLHQIIEAYEDKKLALQNLKRFDTNRHLPQAPMKFCDVKALNSYIEDKSKYEQERKETVLRNENAHKYYARVAEKVKALLPQNTYIVHTYNGSRPELTDGRRYIVRNVVCQYSNKGAHREASTITVHAMAQQTG